MKLSELIRKKGVATLTVATLATLPPIHTSSVATVASVNVANPTEDKSGMTGDEAARVNAWLDYIGAVEPEERSEVIDKCTSDLSALEYFLRRHAEDCAPDLDDSRRPSRIIDVPKGWKPDPCNRCANLSRFAGGDACRVDNGRLLIAGQMLHEVPKDGGKDCSYFKAQCNIKFACKATQQDMPHWDVNDDAAFNSMKGFSHDSK